MVEIEKDVPMPMNGKGTHGKYPWKLMEVGNSFLAANVSINNIGSSRINAQNQTGFKFICRTVEGGVRVWRTA
jgi:hypothetical protein